MNTTRVKEMVFGYNSVDYIGDYINSFVSVFNLELIEWKKLTEYSDGYHDEEQIAIMVKFDFPEANKSSYPKKLLNFICDAEYVDSSTWCSEGISLTTAKSFFGERCKMKNGKIYVNE